MILISFWICLSLGVICFSAIGYNERMLRAEISQGDKIKTLDEFNATAGKYIVKQVLIAVAVVVFFVAAAILGIILQLS